MIELADVIVRRGRSTAVDRVTLHIAGGRWFGVVGANGSGKTSLLRALAGRLPFAGGSCRFKGVERAGDRHARARRVGFAPPLDALPAVLSGGDLLRVAAGAGGAMVGSVRWETRSAWTRCYPGGSAPCRRVSASASRSAVRSPAART